LQPGRRSRPPSAQSPHRRQQPPRLTRLVRHRQRPVRHRAHPTRPHTSYALAAGSNPPPPLRGPSRRVQCSEAQLLRGPGLLHKRSTANGEVARVRVSGGAGALGWGSVVVRLFFFFFGMLNIGRAKLTGRFPPPPPPPPLKLAG
ncbi:hypothetical protein BC936DRAFT_148899, partial [Jimgerdemannia flammicorona]